ncbi:hypothetical protein AAKU61_004362 [Undibacterium sp. GrIS 1.2]
MYSYEDRIRAIKLYIKLEKRICPTIRQLGYPTKNAPKSWYLEYVQSHDLQVRYIRSRQKLSNSVVNFPVVSAGRFQRDSQKPLRPLDRRKFP